MTDNDRSNRFTYRDAGVDIDAGNELVAAIGPLARETERSGTLGAIGNFGALFDLKDAGYDDPLLVSATDGVGTKLKIAIDTGEAGTVGVDLVAMCVNDLVVLGAEPLFFLDYFATGALDVEQATEAVAGIARGCKLAGCALIGGETAEMPGMYLGQDFDMAGFAVGAVERNKVLDGSSIEPGDTVLGLASDGLHSNGFSLVRRLVDAHNLDYSSPPPFGGEGTLASALLVPTRIYVRSLLPLLQDGSINGVSHITGGGFTENLPRMLVDEDHGISIDLDSWDLPPVFTWLRELSGLDDSEMLRTFNCGIGMAVVVRDENVEETIRHLAEAGESVHVIGRVTGSRPVEHAIEWSGSL